MMNLKRFRHIGTLLILALVFTLVPMGSPVYAITKSVPNGTLNINLDSSGKTLTISSTSQVSIPENGFSNAKPIAFDGATLAKVTTLKIEGGITDIESYAFTGLTNLTSVDFTKATSLKAIYFGAFYNCKKLASVKVPDNVKFIQDNAFADNTILSCPNNYSSTGVKGYEVRETLSFNLTQKDSLAFELFKQINNYRKAAKVAGVSEFPGMTLELYDIAKKRASEDAVLDAGTGTISHIRSNGNLFYSIQGRSRITEISSKEPTSKSVASVLNGIISNSTNKQRLLSPDYDRIGIGCMQINGSNYWVIWLGSSRNGDTYKTTSSDTTTSMSVPFPVGSNNVRIDKLTPNLNFKMTPSSIKLGLVEDCQGGSNGKILSVKKETGQARLGIGNISFATNSGGWLSDNTKVSSVSTTGLVKAEGLGTTKIWGTSTLTVGPVKDRYTTDTYQGTKRASLTVTVFEKIRLWGDTRVDTSLRGAEKYMKLLGVSKLDRIIVAYAGNFPDALAGTYLGVVKDAPIVLVYGGVENKVVDWFKSHVNKNAKIWILGGTGVIGNSFDNKLYAAGYKKDEKYVKRLWGQTRFDTNIEILKEAGVNGKDMIVCRGDDYRDSLSASSAARPILLVPKTGKLTQAHRDFLDSIKTSGKCYIIGGTGAVGGPAESQLSPYFNNIKRLWGNTAYDTGRKVSEEFFGKKLESVMVVYSKNFPDGLSGGPIAYKYGAPVLLAADETFRNKEGQTVKGYDMAVDYTKSVGARRVIIMGGTSVIPEKIADAVTKW